MVESAVGLIYEGTNQRKEQNLQHINLTENILLKGCTAEAVRNYDKRSSGVLDSRTAWYFLRLEIFNIYIFQENTQLPRYLPENTELHAASLSSESHNSKS